MHRLTPQHTQLFETKANADAIELDVWLTADGQVAVLHDGNLHRTCGVSKHIRELRHVLHVVVGGTIVRATTPDLALCTDQPIAYQRAEARGGEAIVPLHQTLLGAQANQ